MFRSEIGCGIGVKVGKGVATTIGMVLALSPHIGIFICIIWLLSTLVFRVSSLSALLSVTAMPGLAWVFYVDDFLIIGSFGALACLVYWKHRPNILRLIKGEEPRIGKNKKKESE